MMKKLVLLVLMCLFSLSSIAYADQYSQGYETGRDAANHWMRIAGGGNDNKAFWYNDSYDFSKVKTVIVLTKTHANVSDPYLHRSYVNILNKKFNGSVTFLDFYKLAAEFEIYAQTHNIDSNNIENLMAYIVNTYGTYNFMEVNIYDYNNRPCPGIRTMGNCHVDFELLDYSIYVPNTKGSVNILFYDDQRLDAVNASRGGLLDRITARFKSKFNDALNKKPITD